MARTYKCTNVKFCMDDDVQRQAWEYLHSLGKENGSFGNINRSRLARPRIYITE